MRSRSGGSRFRTIRGEASTRKYDFCVRSRRYCATNTRLVQATDFTGEIPPLGLGTAERTRLSFASPASATPVPSPPGAASTPQVEQCSMRWTGPHRDYSVDAPDLHLE